MRIAPDADFGQMHHGDVASPAVDRFGPQPGHVQARAPVIGAGEFTALFGYNVAVIHDDGNLSECHELVEGNGNAFQRINAARQSRGMFPSGKGKLLPCA